MDETRGSIDGLHENPQTALCLTQSHLSAKTETVTQKKEMLNGTPTTRGQMSDIL